MNNQQNIKVSEAIKKGNRWINIPAIALLVFFLFIVLPILLYVFRNDKNSIVLVIMGILSIVLGFVSPILWWSINIVKYKIWAANNVKDIHRFYEEAKIKNLINDSRFFRKLEIRSKKQELKLSKLYERLDKEKIIVRDFNDSISRETIFKSTLRWNILVFGILIAGMIYLYKTGEYNLKGSLVIICILIVLIFVDIYKILRYKFILKINDKTISYKDDKIIIQWRDILIYSVIPTIGYTHSKLLIETINKNYELVLENYGKIKLGKVVDVLNENKHRFEINESTK